ncbi:nitrogen fixation negative regulator NifL [Methylotuvimicrobium buryatense]|uniref:histidine kinase n=2 Tax=Methylotuvimicrobium buryatense TaxID=95641 RepID=A0A4P9UVS6_METBY|nr:nitrogen fixation negative regulator NifL [Methylotuvimicrobium buryatense]
MMTLFAPSLTIDKQLLDLIESFSRQGKMLPFFLLIKVVEQVPIAISITDKKANILYINQAFTDTTGYRPAEILGRNESELSAKSTPRQVYYDLWHTITRKKIWRGRLINKNKNGAPYLAELTIAPMQDEQGKITHYIGMHRDITQTHASEQKLINQKQLIESVINASPVAMVVIDKNDRVVLDNQVYKMMISDLGLTEPVLFFLKLLRQDMGDLWQYAARKERGFVNRELRIEGIDKRGTRWYACSGNWFAEKETGADAFFSGETKDYLLLSFSDITQQRRQQEELHLQNLRTILAEEEQIRSIRETLLGAMHQIRQPLNQISAAINIMSHRNDIQNQPLRELLEQVGTKGEETLETLQRCVPEIPETAVIPVNLNQILHEVVELSSYKLLANGIVIDWRPSSTLPSVLGSENKLRMLFKQLIDNAIEAMNRAGSRERSIAIATHVDNDRVNVSIEDTGPGIHPDQRIKVFQPFYTTRPMGTIKAGMGLVMVQEIVNQHKAGIEIDPNYDQGCRFKIGFPIYRNAKTKR